MGLDMYLLAKSKNKKIGKEHTTGACGGLFPFTIDSEGTTEIGYWRKNYRLADEITHMLFEPGEETNCVLKELTEDDIKDLISFAQDELDFKDYEDGWYSDYEWEKTIKIFQQALAYAKEGVKIYYKEWY